MLPSPAPRRPRAIFLFSCGFMISYNHAEARREESRRASAAAPGGTPRRIDSLAVQTRRTEGASPPRQGGRGECWDLRACRHPQTSTDISEQAATKNRSHRPVRGLPPHPSPLTVALSRGETDSSWIPDVNPPDALGIGEQRDGPTAPDGPSLASDHAMQCASTTRSLPCGVIPVGHARAARWRAADCFFPQPLALALGRRVAIVFSSSLFRTGRLGYRGTRAALPRTSLGSHYPSAGKIHRGNR